ncbi:unnamed protein product [Brassicogethes aeneus]|uniref:Uncharacterized protein n=1 Tax=Brassicogethes aeneus TaxID=1431903 RepID=A0A9P0BBF6_BRAAE|nr:unnamed protein product [Brassicogethes aeneus]
MTRRSKVSKTSMLICQDVKCDTKVVKHFDTKNNRRSSNRYEFPNFPEIKVFVDNVQKELVNAENNYYKQYLKRTYDRQVLQRKNVIPKTFSIPKTTKVISPKPKLPLARSLPSNRKCVPKYSPKKDQLKCGLESSTTTTTNESAHMITNSNISPETIISKYYANKLKDEIENFKNTNICDKETAITLKIKKIHHEDNSMGMLKTIKKEVDRYSDNILALKEEISKIKDKSKVENVDLVNDIKIEIDEFRNAPLVQTKAILSRSPCVGDWHCGNGELFSYIAVIKSEDACPGAKESDEKLQKVDKNEDTEKDNEIVLVLSNVAVETELQSYSNEVLTNSNDTRTVADSNIKNVTDGVSALSIQMIEDQKRDKKMKTKNNSKRKKSKECMQKLREKIKNDPILYAECKRKERERYHARKEAGKVKSINDLSEKEKKKARAQWRERSRKFRNSVKSDNNPGPSRKKPTEKKIIKVKISRSNTESLKEEIVKLQKQLEQSKRQNEKDRKLIEKLKSKTTNFPNISKCSTSIKDGSKTPKTILIEF